MLNKTSNLTRQLIQDDRTKYTQAIAIEAAEAARKGQARALHSCVRKLGPAEIMRPQSEDAGGTPGENTAPSQTNVADNFCKQASGCSQVL